VFGGDALARSLRDTLERETILPPAFRRSPRSRSSQTRLRTTVRSGCRPPARCPTFWSKLCLGIRNIGRQGRGQKVGPRLADGRVLHKSTNRLFVVILTGLTWDLSDDLSGALAGIDGPWPIAIASGCPPGFAHLGHLLRAVIGSKGC
jgi:hypothetical protein